MSGDMSKKFPKHFQTIHAISVCICLCMSLCIRLCLHMSDHLVVIAGNQTGKQAEKQASQLRQTDGHTYRQAGTCQHITCPHASTCQPTHEHRACLHVLACFCFFNQKANYDIYIYIHTSRIGEPTEPRSPRRADHNHSTVSCSTMNFRLCRIVAWSACIGATSVSLKNACATHSARKLS